MLLRVEQIVPRHLDGQAVIEEGFGSTQVKVIAGFGESDILHVALWGDMEIGAGSECGQYLEIVVKLYDEDWILGADETDG